MKIKLGPDHLRVLPFHPRPVRLKDELRHEVIDLRTKLQDVKRENLLFDQNIRTGREESRLRQASLEAGLPHVRDANNDLLEAVPIEQARAAK